MRIRRQRRNKPDRRARWQRIQMLSESDERRGCAEARAHGIAPVHRDHPAYQYMNDRDDDGIVCE